MPTTRRDDPTQLLRQALAGLDAQIAQWQKTRTQLAALLDQPPAVPTAAPAAPQKRQRSAAWRAKLSAAAKARWARVKKEQAKAQKPKQTAKTARSKAKPAKARPAPAKANKSTAKKTLALQGKEISKPKTRKPDVNTPAGIVERLALAGARFRFTRGGSLIIGNLGSLPPDAQRMFLDHPNPRLLTAAARQYLVSGTQSSEK